MPSLSYQLSSRVLVVFPYFPFLKIDDRPEDTLCFLIQLPFTSPKSPILVLNTFTITGITAGLRGRLAGTVTYQLYSLPRIPGDNGHWQQRWQQSIASHCTCPSFPPILPQAVLPTVIPELRANHVASLSSHLPFQLILLTQFPVQEAESRPGPSVLLLQFTCPSFTLNQKVGNTLF